MNAPIRFMGRTADQDATRKIVREAVAAHAKGKDVDEIDVVVMNANTVKVSYTVISNDRWATNKYPVTIGKISI